MGITPLEKANHRLGKTASLWKNHSGGWVEWEWMGNMGNMGMDEKNERNERRRMGVMGVDRNGWELWEWMGAMRTDGHAGWQQQWHCCIQNRC